MPNPLAAHPAHVSTVLLAGLGSSLGAVFLFGKIADEVKERQAMAFDVRVVEEAREMRSPALDRAMSAATATGEPWALGLVCGLVALRWRSQDRDADMATLALAVIGGTVVNGILKIAFRRPRPALKLRRAHASGYSFPSGHAMTTLAIYGTMAYLAARRGARTRQPAAALLWAPILLLCALVGYSRVYLEVHYPTDVIGGWAAGTVWLTTCGIARSFMEPEES
ncbi:MAG: phosphatase PAP2 family protein [Chloroflexia bacterium]